MVPLQDDLLLIAAQKTYYASIVHILTPPAELNFKLRPTPAFNIFTTGITAQAKQLVFASGCRYLDRIADRRFAVWAGQSIVEIITSLTPLRRAQQLEVNRISFRGQNELIL